MGEFGLDGVVIARSDADGRLDPLVAVGKADAALGSEPAGRVFAAPGGPGRPGRWIVAQGAWHRRIAAPVANFPLRSDDRQIGMLRLVGRSDGFADDETRLLATIADRLAVDLEQEQLREEANRAEVLRRTDELRTALLSSVSHDLRTPLAAIKASGESLLQDDIAWSDGRPHGVRPGDRPRVRPTESPGRQPARHVADRGRRAPAAARLVRRRRAGPRGRRPAAVRRCKGATSSSRSPMACRRSRSTT